MTDSQKFCTSCGCNIGPDMQFCPQCGRVVEGTEASCKQAQMRKETEQMINDGRRTYLSFAILVYALPAIIAGIVAIIEASHVANALFSNDDFLHYYASHDWSFSKGDLEHYIMYIAAMEIASGACAAATVYFIQKKKQRKLAFLFCMIASVLCIWSIFGMFIGFLMSWTVYDSDGIFEDEEN